MSPYPEMVVDLHTHLFNARYVPLKGILKEKGVPGWLAGLAKRLLNLLTGKADFVIRPHRAVIDGLGEDDSLEPLANLLATVASREMAERVVTKGLMIGQGSRSSRAKATHAALRSDELYGVLEEIEESAWPGTRGNIARHQADEVSKLIEQLSGVRGLTDDDVLDRVGDWIFRRFRRALLWLLDKLLETILGDAWGTALDYIKFFLLMLSKERTLRDALFAGYDDDQNVGLVAHMMMDMQKAYGNDRPYYRFYKEQIKRMEAVVEGSEGKLIGFVAFDPRRSKGLDIVRYALRRGNCGVKVYPPMGYPAYGSSAEQHERFRDLYAYCSREQVPVLTHCSPVGFEAYKGSGVLSDPQYWLAVLDDFQDLRLCYGHAGGGGDKNLDPETGETVPYFGWYAEDDEQWDDGRNFARKVAEHCCRFPNVYCDFSYFGAMVEDPAKAGHFKRNLVSALDGRIGNCQFGDKIMYGSDWHMPKMARHAAEFLAFWKDLFEDPKLAPHRDGFFFENARRFLNLA